MAGMICRSCDAVYVNGVLCHEQGCPDSWRTELRECRWCGTEFKPLNKDQEYCDSSCADCDNGVFTNDDERLEERYGD
jgi:hypothetical protein